MLSTTNIQGSYSTIYNYNSTLRRLTGYTVKKKGCGGCWYFFLSKYTWIQYFKKWCTVCPTCLTHISWAAMSSSSDIQMFVNGRSEEIWLLSSSWPWKQNLNVCSRAKSHHSAGRLNDYSETVAPTLTHNIWRLICAQQSRTFHLISTVKSVYINACI